MLKANSKAVVELVQKVCAAFNWTIASTSTNYIIIKTGVSFRSWGENIEVSISPSTKGHVNVLLKSAQKLGVTDWGKSNENIKTLADALQQKFR